MNCVKKWTLYLAYTKSAPDVRDLHHGIYSDHLRTCPACRQERAEMTEYSRTAAMPEMSITEMETA
jgi:predicted anti-sigma-YlaC factor YlaD